jgi:hypothetical protein
MFDISHENAKERKREMKETKVKMRHVALSLLPWSAFFAFSLFRAFVQKWSRNLTSPGSKAT